MPITSASRESHNTHSTHLETFSMPLFIALSHVPQGTATKRHSPPSDLVKTHFHFFCRLKPQAKWLPIESAWSMVLTHLQVSECLTLKLLLILHQTSPHSTHFTCKVLPWLPNSDLFFRSQFRWNFLQKSSLTYLPATRSGTASVFPWHPVPCSTCNFFFLIGPTSH